jgi:putative oxidoreductase
VNHGCNVHGFENVGNGIQVVLQYWTNGHVIRRLGQFQSSRPDIYSTALDEKRAPKAHPRRKVMAAGTTTIGYDVEAKSISQGAVVLLARFFFVAIFLMAGPNHFSKQTIAFAASQGVPVASIAVPFSGVLALAGGLSILLGYRAKIGAWLIALFLVAVTPMMHKFWGISDPAMAQMQMIMFMKNVSMLGGALLITQLGAGPWSLDSRPSR